MTATSSPEPSLATASPAGLSFSGTGREFLRLLVKGSLLQIPTFGFYRFWLTTKTRRPLGATPRLSDESFEYTGTAKEILIGFLIALAVLTPVYLGYFLLGAILEGKKAFASIPLVAVMYVLAHFGSYRSRRYRASRTVFRGLRFCMNGSGWAYAVRAILWDAANILTLGLALPWASASLERYRMRHTHFASLPGAFVGTRWQLYKRGWWLWLSLWLVPSFVIAGAYSLFKRMGEPAAVFAGIVGLVVVATMLLAYPVALAILTRWRIEGVRFGEITLTSHLPKRAFFAPCLKLVASSIGFFSLFGLAVAILAFVFRDQTDALESGDWNGTTLTLIVATALLYLVVLLGFGVIQRYFMIRGLWAVIASSITVLNFDAVERVAAAGQPSGSVGEGLADALDFGAGF